MTENDRALLVVLKAIVDTLASREQKVAIANSLQKTVNSLQVFDKSKEKFAILDVAKEIGIELSA